MVLIKCVFSGINTVQNDISQEMLMLVISLVHHHSIAALGNDERIVIDH